jgi:hypothetical protein
VKESTKPFNTQSLDLKQHRDDAIHRVKEALHSRKPFFVEQAKYTSGHFAALTSTGPRTASKSTYAVENGPSCGSRPAPSPAITIENSPLATKAIPARTPLRASR